MRFEVFTLFPEVFTPYLATGVLGKAAQSGLLSCRLHNIRDYASDKHRTTDDEPYGGGGGMVMKPEPLFAAVEDVLGEQLPSVPVILLTPQGKVFNQKMAVALARLPRLALICGRYEGFDERIREHLVTDEISIGDYVLSGGELPALVLIDSIARLIAGVLGDEYATENDSHAEGLLEYPHYTRPADFRGWKVPEILLSGNHARVAAWRREQSLQRTLRRRPDLIEGFIANPSDEKILKRLRQELSDNVENR